MRTSVQWTKNQEQGMIAEQVQKASAIISEGTWISLHSRSCRDVGNATLQHAPGVSREYTSDGR